jgi:hypothetical protein
MVGETARLPLLGSFSDFPLRWRSFTLGRYSELRLDRVLNIGAVLFEYLEYVNEAFQLFIYTLYMLIGLAAAIAHPLT